MRFADVLLLESHFDRLEIEKLHLLANSPSSSRDSIGIAARLMIAIYDDHWSEGLAYAEQMFICNPHEDPRSAIEKGFALQFAIAATEEVYDMDAREKWLKRWSEISGWAEHRWLKYLRLFQTGVSQFFLGELNSAKAHFRRALEVAESMPYERGILRARFHLALIQSELGDESGSLEEFSLVLRRAQLLDNFRMIARVQDHLGKANKGLQIENYIKRQNLSAARKLLLHWERERRQKARSRGFHSLAYYWAIFFMAKGRRSFEQIVLKHIQDPVMRERFFRFKSELVGLSQSEASERSFLVGSLGLNQAGNLKSLAGVRVALNQQTDLEVARLVQLLMKYPMGVTKEFIAKELWNYSYEPVAHDGRIYKLISKARKSTGEKDLFQNTYGQYRLNPLFVS